MEQMSEGVSKAAENQMPVVNIALNGFATITLRCELARKSLYERLHGFSSGLFNAASRNTVPLSESLTKRSETLRKLGAAQRKKPTQEHPKQQQAARSANDATITEVRQWLGPHGGDTKRLLREYAMAQIEYSARAIEQWSSFLEDLALLDFSKDTDDVVSMMERGAIAQV